MSYYVPRGYGLFEEQLASLPSEMQRSVISAIRLRLYTDPRSEKNPTHSKMLHGPLDCIRRIHVGSDFVIAYIVCEECVVSFDRTLKMPCQSKIGCLRCSQEPRYRVKLISCGYRAGFYKELESNWRAWSNTTIRSLES